MRKLLLLFLIFSVITSTGFSQTIDYKKVLLPAQANNKTKTHQLFKAPLGSTHSVYTPSFIKADQEAYAGNTTDEVYNSIALADGTLTATGTIVAEPFPMSEEFADGVVYRVYSDLTLDEVNPDDGTTTALGTITGITGTPTGLAYDWSNQVMYVVVLDGSNLPHLCTLDMTTYAVTEVGVGTGMIISMDFANDGYLYGVAIDDDNLYQIDPATGAGTSVGAIGIDLNYGQDISYDPVSEQLYAITCGASYEFGTYDLTTGAFTAIADAGGIQFGTLVVCNYPADPGAPAAVSDLTATPDAGGALTADVSWTNPNLDFSGNTLTELTSIDLYLDGAETPEYTNASPTIGGAENETITVLTAGFHAFKVIGTNSAGVGVPTTVTVWVGEDVPAAPTNVGFTNTDMEISLTWDAPTEGLHGEYFTGTGVTYTVVRYPGEVVVSEDQAGLTFSETLSEANNYYYEIIASNASGQGGVATSETILLGDIINFDFEAGLPEGGELIDGACGWLFGNNGSSDYWTIPEHGNYAYVNDDECNGDMSDVWMILPPVDFTEINAPWIKFENVRNYDIFTIKASLDGTTWDDVEVLSSDNISAWQEETVDLTAYANEPIVFIAFHYNDDGAWAYGWAVDDVMMPGSLITITCPKPTDLTVTDITTNSAVLGWTSSSDTWNIEWGTLGFTQGEGTLIEGTSDNPYTLSDLDSGTAYEFYVQADCGGGDLSLWAGPFSFTTEYVCDVIDTYPFFEGFETAVPPACWLALDEDGDGYNWTQVPATSHTTHTGDFAAMSQSWDGSPLTPDNYLITPQLDINADNLELRFWVAAQDPDYPSDKFSVMVSTTGTAPADFTEIYTETLSSEVWSEVVLSLADYNGELIYIAIRHWDCTDLFQMKLDDFLVDFETGISESVSKNVNLYPNPSTGLVNISSVNGAEISVTNMLGQEVYRTVSTQDVLTIDASTWGQGSYMVRVIENGEVSVMKFNIVK
ncbi:MAG TPA: choice-of-anchor J domain-containing protein [Bacteroidales bacterium]|nr:choice-of-anchor J domain-containing protein [Bacteroidales bacterium]